MGFYPTSAYNPYGQQQAYSPYTSSYYGGGYSPYQSYASAYSPYGGYGGGYNPASYYGGAGYGQPSYYGGQNYYGGGDNFAPSAPQAPPEPEPAAQSLQDLLKQQPAEPPPAKKKGGWVGTVITALVGAALGGLGWGMFGSKGNNQAQGGPPIAEGYQIKGQAGTRLWAVFQRGGSREPGNEIGFVDKDGQYYAKDEAEKIRLDDAAGQQPAGQAPVAQTTTPPPAAQATTTPPAAQQPASPPPVAQQPASPPPAAQTAGRKGGAKKKAGRRK